MNRKKKLNNILKKRLKKINAKSAPANKSTYVSKAVRAKLAEQVEQKNMNIELTDSD